ncbi:MAG: LacI family DNA-binding transcriptional regulator [Candidatus Omnitrophota bacterium]|nr:LacI family DNA-binding transcriptional regulator [Candidatus Omnitrophota bacterium]
MPHTYKDIARITKVSPTTISRVINNKELYKVSKENQERVRKIIKKLDFTPNVIARSLVCRKTFNIAVGIRKLNDIMNPYFNRIISGLGSILQENGYHLQLSTVAPADGSSSLPPYSLTMREKRAEGLCLISQEADIRDIMSLYKQKIPLVLVDKYIPSQKIPSVLIDNKKGLYLAVKKLIELGHRRIAFLTGLQDLPYSRDRLSGYKKALEEEGITFDKRLVVRGAFDFEKDYSITARLLDVKPAFTALLTSDDVMAAAAMRKITERGFSIPKDISVIGFNDIVFPITSPVLSSIYVPLVEIGKIAGKMLLETVHKKRLKKKVVTFVPELIQRESMGRRRAGGPQNKKRRGAKK